MPSIYEVSRKIDNADTILRRESIENLYKITNRNVICYYSNFLSSSNSMDLDINDNDMHGFMSTVYNLDKKQGLDLILHTPGGDPTALESIVSYLYSIFGKENIRAVIPHMAMSAGTMFACACNEIIMGKHSNLGPIDPQFGGIPAFDIIQEFEKAKEEMSNTPETSKYWSILLSKYPVAFYERCKKATELSETLLKKWLKENMFRGGPNIQKRINKVINKLNENINSKTHSRHFDINQCKEMGLKIIDLEENGKIQEAVLTIHHCYMHTFNRNNVQKIIENQIGGAVVIGSVDS